MVRHVTPDDRAQIIMLHAEGMSQREIARKTGWSNKTVQRQLQGCPEVLQKVTQKKEEVCTSVFDELESLKPTSRGILSKWAKIIEKFEDRVLEGLEDDEKSDNYLKYLTQASTAIGVYIDKMTMTEAKQPGMRKDNNLFDAIDRSVEGAIDYSDIPEIQSPPETGDDLVGPSGTEQI